MKKLKYIEYTDYDEEKYGEIKYYQVLCYWHPANRGWMKTRNIR